jgi:hypothetical protein
MKILTLSTFSIANPRSGGEHRVHNIAEFYRSLGHEVRSVGVMGGGQVITSPGFVPFPPRDELSTFIGDCFVMEDWGIGKVFGMSDQYFDQLRACIPFAPDLIHIEHPWLFEFAQRYAKSVPGRAPFLLYGSANIEHQLKYAALIGHPAKAQAERYRDLALVCETNAIKNADGVCCVSEHDLKWTREIADSSENINIQSVLAPNGVRARPSSITGIEKANKISQRRKFALYCASAHLPNVTGFFDIFRDGIGSIAPDEALIVAGSAGAWIINDQRSHRIAGLHGRVVNAGEVDEECIKGLLDTASAIILPITAGGGTNLKTAEALWAKKHVVATTTAMRGFEEFSGQPGIAIEDKPAKFQRALLNAMNAPEVVLSEDEAKSRDQVLWSSTLAPLGQLLKLRSSQASVALQK